jgi:hypothetical protein
MVKLIEEGKTVDEIMQLTGETRDAVYGYRRRYRLGKFKNLPDVEHGEETH